MQDAVIVHTANPPVQDAVRGNTKGPSTRGRRKKQPERPALRDIRGAAPRIGKYKRSASSNRKIPEDRLPEPQSREPGAANSLWDALGASGRSSGGFWELRKRSSRTSVLPVIWLQNFDLKQIQQHKN